MWFWSFAKLKVVLKYDTKLITALVKSWRPKINILFMRHDKMILTLDDVGYIMVSIFWEVLIYDDISDLRSYFEAT